MTKKQRTETSTDQGIKCPKCHEPIWDYAFGHKLNKCWECGLAFDGPFEDEWEGDEDVDENLCENCNQSSRLLFRVDTVDGIKHVCADCTEQFEDEGEGD